MKKIFVTKPSLPPLEEYVEEIKDIWDNGILTNQGPKHNQLLEQLKGYLNTKNILLYANGHLALENAIEAYGLKGEIITTPFTFASTTQAIIRNGCTPVFCDIKETDYTIDPSKIEALITNKTVAIVPVHVYGNICDVESIERIAKKHNLKVIYDAAHAFGEYYKGENVANFGDISMFSFHATKVFNSVEGGCLTYRDANLTKRLECIRQFGQIIGTDSYPCLGGNSKMTEFHAAMGLCNLKHVDEYINKRRIVVEAYRHRLANIKGIKLSSIDKNTRYNYAYFPIVVEEKETHIDRETIASALLKNNIYVRKYFWPLCNDFEVLKDMGFDSKDTPIAKYVSDRVLSLPCYSDLSVDDVNRICDIIINLYTNN